MDKKFEQLIGDIVEGKCALFLGAGASATSLLENGQTAPIGNGLSKILYNHFFPKEIYENETLASTSGLITKNVGYDKLQDFLFMYLKNIKPSTGLQNLTKFRWKNIYTTNIETAIEIAYQNSKERAQNLEKVIGPLDIASQDKQTQVTLYKLHGCITRRDVGMVFSLEEYATSKEDHLKLFSCLSIDLIDSNMIFIGYSMIDSNFQEVWAAIKKYCKTTKSPNKYYYVSPFLKAPSITYLESEGFVVFNMGIDEFFENLVVQSRGHRKSLEEYYSENLKPVKLFEKINLIPEYKYRLSKNYDFPLIEVSYPHVKSNSFYRGNEPSWAEVKYNLDARRDLLEDLLQAFSEWHQIPRMALWVITGRAGDGKSMLLKRFAFEAALKIGETVLFSKSKADLDPQIIIDLYRKIKSPLVIFIDNTTDRIAKVNRLISFIKNEKAKILIVGTSRSSDWNLFYKDFYLTPGEFSLDRLSDDEIKGVLEKLRENGSLDHLGGLDEKERFLIFKEKSKRELLVALKEATSNKNFDEIIANEYATIRSEKGQLAYLYICLINQFRYHIPQSLLARVMGLDLSTIHENIFKYTDQIVFIEESIDGSDYLLRARHSIIAQIVVEYYLSGDVNKYNFLEDLLRNYIPSSPLEKSLVKKIYHHSTIRQLFHDIDIGVKCYELLSIHVPGDYFILQQKALFLSDYKKDYQRAKQAIGEAKRSSNSFLLQNTEGTILLNEALFEEDYSTSKYLMEKGKRILLHIIDNNYKNNSYNYHSLINHLIAWYEKFDKDDSQILEEIQQIIDEALRKHPNDHMILTECGRLEKIMNNSKDAITYFRQAIAINPGNLSARYLLARSLLSKGELANARTICDDGIRYSLKNHNLNRLRFEILHKSHENSENIKKAYQHYLSENESDDYIKLMYGAYLYVIGDNECDDIFFELRKSPRINYDEKYYPHFQIAKYLGLTELTESGRISRVIPTGFYVASIRFNTKTLCFLSIKKNVGGRTSFEYKYTFNYSGPFIYHIT